MTRLLKDFDLPQKYLDGDGDHVPQKARDPAEIARRRALRPGMLIYEQQHTGLAVAKRVLELVDDQPAVHFASETVAVAGLTSAWYLFGRGAKEQRKRLKLEMLAADEPELRPSAYMLLQNAQHDLQHALDTSQRLMTAAAYGPRAETQPRIALARTIGHTSLTLACVPIGDAIGYDLVHASNADLQFMARARGLHVLQQGRLLGKQLRTAPSMAGFADTDSDLSVYWRRSAPDGAVDALVQASEELGVA